MRSVLLAAAFAATLLSTTAASVAGARAFSAVIVARPVIVPRVVVIPRPAYVYRPPIVVTPAPVIVAPAVPICPPEHVLVAGICQ